jgi:hypothetical protein
MKLFDRSVIRIAIAVFMVIAVSLTAWAGGSRAPVAKAAPPPYDCGALGYGDPHCYSTGDQARSLVGLAGTWYDTALIMPTQEVEDIGHMSNEIWLATSNNANHPQWAEEGLSRGCSVNPLPGDPNKCWGTSSLNGSDAYMQFWADIDYGGTPYFHVISIFSADPNHHTYTIWNKSNGANSYYDIYVDWSWVGRSTIQPSPSGVGLQAGLELYSPDSTPSYTGINPNEWTGDWLLIRLHTYGRHRSGARPGLWKRITPTEFCYPPRPALSSSSAFFRTVSLGDGPASISASSCTRPAWSRFSTVIPVSPSRSDFTTFRCWPAWAAI